jgi:glycosyltransferase involved in cell wall biosynthesis
MALSRQELRIVFLIPNLRKGGAEKLVIDIVRALSQRGGIEIRLVLLENEIQFEIPDILHLIRIMPGKTRLSLWKKNILDIDHFQSFLEDFEPHIIHTHLFEAEIFSRSCQYPRAKWFSHVHDFIPQLQNFSIRTITNKRLITNLYEKYYLLKQYKKNGGNTFLTISKAVNEYIKTVIPSQFKYTLLPNAVDLKQYHVQDRKHTSDPNILKIISVGRLDKNKNHLFLIHTIKELMIRGINSQLEILGEGLERNSLEKEIQELELQDRIKLIGNTDNVTAYLNDADLYVHSSIYEGFGLTILEAMACGLPVISTDGIGNRELVINSENGFLITDFNPTMMADKIELLYNDHKLRMLMGEKSLKISKNFDLELYIDQLLGIYQSAKL